MSEELKPCPFCGSHFVAQGASRDKISVWCKCGAQGPEVPFPEINPDPSVAVRECIRLWNRRADPSQARLSEAVKVLEEIAQMQGVNGGHYDIGEEFRNTQSLRLNEQCRVLAKRFLATIGEENE